MLPLVFYDATLKCCKVCSTCMNFLMFCRNGEQYRQRDDHHYSQDGVEIACVLPTDPASVVPRSAHYRRLLPHGGTFRSSTNSVIAMVYSLLLNVSSRPVCFSSIVSVAELVVIIGASSNPNIADSQVVLAYSLWHNCAAIL